MTALPDKYRYVAVEGPIGVGKTSLAHKLAAAGGGAPLLEDPDANPFLPGFYQDQSRYALPTQLFFLFQRLNQVRTLNQSDLFRRVTIADFIIDKDPLFARLTLNDDELRLYQQIFAHVKPQAPTPDLVIYLQAPADTLVGRIRRRGVAYERGMSEDYLLGLADSYARFFSQYDASQLLIVNTEHLNFVDSAGDFDLLLRRIDEMRGAREFFNLGA